MSKNANVWQQAVDAARGISFRDAGVSKEVFASWPLAGYDGNGEERRHPPQEWSKEDVETAQRRQSWGHGL